MSNGEMIAVGVAAAALAGLAYFLLVKPKQVITNTTGAGPIYNDSPYERQPLGGANQNQGAVTQTPSDPWDYVIRKGADILGSGLTTLINRGIDAGFSSVTSVPNSSTIVRSATG